MRPALYYHLPAFLRSNGEYPDWQDRARELARLLANFLTSNDLVRSDVRSRFLTIDDNFSLRSEDLNPRGQKVMDDACMRWLRANGDTRKPLSVVSLERALKRVLKAEATNT